MLSFVVAVAENGVIGRGGDLPWRMSSDLKIFRKLTMGKPIIMGRRTFETLKKPLDGRHNIVVTRDAGFKAPGASVCKTIDEAIDLAYNSPEHETVEEVMVIGGAEIYRQTIDKADRIYLTVVHGRPDGDTFMQPLDPAIWREVSTEAIEQGPRDEYPATLKVLVREPPAESKAAPA